MSALIKTLYCFQGRNIERAEAGGIMSSSL